MKQLLFILLLTIPSFLFCQILNEERTGFTETFEFQNISNEEIMSKTKEWLVLTYSTEEFKLILDEDNKLICKGYFEISDTNYYVKPIIWKPGVTMNSFKFSHKIIIDVKNSRMRIKFKEFEYINQNEVIYSPFYFCQSSSDSIGIYLSEIQTRNRITSLDYRKKIQELMIEQSLKTRIGLYDSLKKFHTQLQKDLIKSIKDIDEW